MKKIQKVCVVAPTWRRPLIATLFCQQLVRWRKYIFNNEIPIDLRAFIVGSEVDESQNMVEYAFRGTPGFHYTEFPNQPLGRKFNAGVKMAQTIGADYVMILGDDAFCLPTVFNDLALAFSDGVKYIGCRDLYSWDYAMGFAHYWPGYKGKREGEPIGSGRVIHSSLLDEFDWLPYDDLKNKNLDYSMTQRLGEMADLRLLDMGLDHMMTTVKGDNNITDMYKFEGVVPVETHIFYELFN